MNNPQKLTRAIYRAIEIPGLQAPYHTASLKLYYPAQLTGSDSESNTGLVPAIEQSQPFPIVLLMPGVNVNPEAYGWLADILAQMGIVTVTYQLVAEEMPGYISITPGLDLTQIRPDTYGQKPSGIAIAAIIAALTDINNEGILADKLDLNHIVLGGHSAGGTAALINANPEWFSNIKAVFSYGAHTGAATALGFAPNTVLTIHNALPLLLIGGTEDGCIAHSKQRYNNTDHDDLDTGALNDATARIEQCFQQAIAGGKQDKHLLLIDGANHFSLAHPADTSTGRHFIDRPVKGSEQAIRTLLADTIYQFIAAYHPDMGISPSQFMDSIRQPNPLIAKSLTK